LTVLEGLDPGCKRILLQFLYESELILKDKPVFDLGFADMSGAVLSRVDLSGTNLIEPDLSDANLSGAEGMSHEGLERQAASLAGATMPNGSKHN
jgi:uncharacterized protein YjbI with pentapeptide repeats